MDITTRESLRAYCERRAQELRQETIHGSRNVFEPNNVFELFGAARALEEWARWAAREDEAEDTS